MFFPEGCLRVHLYGQPCDMCRSFDGLRAMVRHELGADPLDGALYCFINRRATQMRALYFGRCGLCTWAKRLEAGRFISDWSRAKTRQMDFTAPKMLLEPIEPLVPLEQFPRSHGPVSHGVVCPALVTP